MSKHYLIIGSSAAGIGVLAKLRELDSAGRITMITAEKEMPYNRCLLADLLAGRRSEEQARTKNAAFFYEKNISLRLATFAVDLDAAKQEVLLSSGEKLGYDKLFLGTGKSAFVPQVVGATTHGVFPFFGLDDVKTIEDYLRVHEVKQIAVIGAGLTGLECADALQVRGLKISIIERTNKLLGNLIDQQGSLFLEEYMRVCNIALYKNASVVEIKASHGKVSDVMLADGTTIPAQLVIFATGGKTNNELAKQAGLACVGQGLWVNEQMQTSNETIYAGGDLCMVKDQLTGSLVQNCLWSDAVQQGMVAASNMAGCEKKYAGTLVVSASQFFELTFASCGQVNNQFKQELIKQEKSFYHRLSLEEGKLKGFFMIGNVTNLGLLRKTLLEKREANLVNSASL